MAEATRPLHRHPSPHRELWRRYRHYAAQQEFRTSVVISLALFFGSVVISYWAIQYATDRASNPVTDIILSNTPALDVDGLFVYGTLLLIAFAILLLFAHPKRIPFMLRSLTLFYLTRSVFVTLTHIGPFAIQNTGADWGTVARHVLYGSDLFFSGHVGAPFLLALVFWKQKNIRNIFIAWSLYMAVVVLLGHYHYTIDVLSAYFITYTIYNIAVWMFPRDHALLLSEVPDEFI